VAEGGKINIEIPDKKEYVDMMEAGVIDPTKLIRLVF